MKKQRRTYPEDLKRSALELVENSGKSAAAVARDLGIDPCLLNRWGREASREGNGTKAFTGHGVPRNGDMAKVLREVTDLREENEILKIGGSHLLGERNAEMSFRFMDAHRDRWSIGKMAGILRVSVSGYYAWKRRKPSCSL